MFAIVSAVRVSFFASANAVLSAWLVKLKVIMTLGRYT